MAIGIDITRTARFKPFRRARDHAFVKKVFTAKEISYCFKFKDPSPHLAGTFAAKEAVRKAIGTGYFVPDVEIRRKKNGTPQAWYRGKKLRISISIAHEDGIAVAVAVKN